MSFFGFLGGLAAVLLVAVQGVNGLGVDLVVVLEVQAQELHAVAVPDEGLLILLQGPVGLLGVRAVGLQHHLDAAVREVGLLLLVLLGLLAELVLLLVVGGATLCRIAHRDGLLLGLGGGLGGLHLGLGLGLGGSLGRHRRLRLRLGGGLTLQPLALGKELLLLAGQLAGGLLLPRQLAPQPLQVVHGGLLDVQLLGGQLLHQLRHVLQGGLAAGLGGRRGALAGHGAGVLVGLAVGLRAVRIPLLVGGADLLLADGIHGLLPLIRGHVLQGGVGRVALGVVEPQGGNLATAGGRHQGRLLLGVVSLLGHGTQHGEHHLVHQHHVVVGGAGGLVAILRGRLAATPLGGLQGLHQGTQRSVLGLEITLQHLLHGHLSQGRRHFWGTKAR